MSIKDIGYLDYFGAKCIYIQDEMDYVLMPADEESNIQRHFMDENYLLTFSDNINKHCVVSVKKQLGSGSHHIRLGLNYIYKGISDEAIDGFIMKGNEIDEFFSPLEYYFRQKRQNEYSPKDLLYEQDIISHYMFECCGKNVEVELVYGNILTESIRTDLTMHPQLIVKFDSTHDTDFVFLLSSVIIKLLQLVHRKTSYNINKFELFHRTDKGISNIGYMFSSLYNKDYRANARIEASFMLYKEKISNLLSMIAGEDAFPLSHLCPSIEQSYKYTSERLGAISSAFEYEYERSKEYPHTSELECHDVKKSILDFIDQIQSTGAEVSKFKEQAKNNIGKIGTQLGLKAKIQNAYSINAGALSSSLPFLLGRLKTIEHVASIFPRLRGKVLHQEMGYEFNDDEIECIRFIEILQYVMVLRRAEYTDKEIEVILGALYYCNEAYMKQIMAESTESH